MENKQKNIDDLFREELDGYVETPPPAVWGALEKKLAKVPKGGYINRRMLYLSVICILLVLSVPVVRGILNLSGSGSAQVADNTVPMPSTTHASTQQPGGNTQSETKANNPPPDNNTGNNKPANNNETGGQNSKNEITGNNTNKNNDNPKENISKTGTTPRNRNNAKSDCSTSDNRTVKHDGNKTSGRSTNDNGNEAENGEQAGNIPYNAHSPNPAPMGNRDNNQTDEPNQAPANQNNPNSPANNAKDPGKPNDQKKNEPVRPPKVKQKFPRFEAGVKTGFERGFDNDASKKAVFSPYVLYNISPKFAVMIQPAVKYATLNRLGIGDPKSYYRANNDSAVTATTDHIPVYGLEGDTFWIWHYRYSQTHDSIVKSNFIKGSYTEFELPVLLKYCIAKGFSVYGGVNVQYRKSVAVQEETFIAKNILATDTTHIQLGRINQPSPAPQYSTSTLIQYQGTDYSNYTGPLYATSQTDMLSVGYMLGFSYEYNKRWLFDALVQQAPAKSNVQAGYNVNTSLAAPYFRLTLGYKLTK